MAAEFDRARLRTVHVVPVTAFDSTGAVNREVQHELIRRLYSAGVRTFLPAAGTSEFHSLSPDEIVEQVRITRAAASDAVIFAPVGMQVAAAIDVGRRSIEAGADGIMFMPFTHPYLSDEGAKDYYRAVIGAVRCPIIFYKKAAVPSDALLLKLAADRRVVGVKYATNALDEFRRTVLASKGAPEWLCGSAERFAPYFMLAGATGYTSGAANVCPRTTLAMHAAFARGDHAEGMRLQALILPIESYRARQGDSYNVSMLKYAVQRTGLDVGPPRPPQRQLSADEKAEIDAILEPILAAESQPS